MSTLNHKEKAEALLEFLREAHAEQYTGTDDNMSDDLDSWISNLEDKEICAMVLKVFHDGI